MEMRELTGRIDFGILAIREDEFEAILDRFPKQGVVEARRRYRIRQLELGNGEVYTIAVVRCAEQGNTDALNAARDMLEDLDPAFLLVVGIAGGVPAHEFTLGDVIVSSRIVDFSVEALLKDHSHEFALGGGPLAPDAAKLVADIRAMVLDGELEAWNERASIGMDTPPVEIEDGNFYGGEDWTKDLRAKLERHFLGKRLRAPRVVTGAIASSDRLIKEAETLQVWLKIARQIQAVEMESAGVYKAAHGRVPFLAIRGISDVVGFKRHPDWTTYACHSAAAFTRALLLARPIPARARGTTTKCEPAKHDRHFSTDTSPAGGTQAGDLPTAPNNTIARNDSKTDIEIAKLRAMTWIACTTIATIGGVTIAYFGLKAALILSVAIGGVAMISRNRMNAMGTSGRMMSGAQVGVTWIPVGTSLLIMAAVATASRLILSKRDTGPTSEDERKAVVPPQLFADPGSGNNVAPVASVNMDPNGPVASPRGDATGPNRAGGSHRGKPPSVRMGATHVAGTLPNDVILRTVNSNQGFRGCYQRAVGRLQTAAGAFTIAFTIDRDGGVVDVHVKDSTVTDYTIVSCVGQVFSGLTFPQPEGGVYHVEYSVKVVGGGVHVPSMGVHRDRSGDIIMDGGTEKTAQASANGSLDGGSPTDLGADPL
jgi:nucleoside phosphorylase